MGGRRLGDPLFVGSILRFIKYRSCTPKIKQTPPPAGYQLRLTPPPPRGAEPSTPFPPCHQFEKNPVSATNSPGTANAAQYPARYSGRHQKPIQGRHSVARWTAKVGAPGRCHDVAYGGAHPAVSEGAPPPPGRFSHPGWGWFAEARQGMGRRCLVLWPGGGGAFGAGRTNALHFPRFLY